MMPTEKNMKIVNMSDKKVKTNLTRSKFLSTFKIESTLQQAIYGAVVLATHQTSGVRRAVKIVSKKLSKRRRSRRNIPVFEDAEMEFDLLTLSRDNPHPNVLPLAPTSEQFQDDDNIYVTMPFMEGGELFAHVQDNGPFEETDAYELFKGIVNGLRHFHDVLGFVHNDLSLENVLLTSDLTPVLNDFGLATRVGTKWDRDRRISGKIPYQAPEIFNGTSEISNPKSDVFSLGVILFVLLTGIPPFEHPDKADQRYVYIQTERLDELLQLWGVRLSDDVIDLLTMMLRENPEDRISLKQVIEHSWIQAKFMSSEMEMELDESDNDEDLDSFLATSAPRKICTPKKFGDDGNNCLHDASPTDHASGFEAMFRQRNKNTNVK